jgi:hypothetical protein
LARLNQAAWWASLAGMQSSAYYGPTDYKPVFPAWKASKLSETLPMVDASGLDLISVRCHEWVSDRSDH